MTHTFVNIFQLYIACIYNFFKRKIAVQTRVMSCSSFLLIFVHLLGPGMCNEGIPFIFTLHNFIHYFDFSIAIVYNVGNLLPWDSLKIYNCKY